MRYELRLAAYDVMDQVWVSFTLRATEPTLGAQPHVVLALSTQVQGTGESVDTEWVKDALTAMIEEL